MKALETSRSMSEIINDAVQEALAEDADDLLLFEERVNEDLISYEQMINYSIQDKELRFYDFTSEQALSARKV